MPFLGIVENAALTDQPRGTTPESRNVRNYNPLTDRHEISQRAGLARYASQRLNGANAGQDLNQVSQVLDHRRVVEDELLMEDAFDGSNGTFLGNPNTRDMPHAFVEFEDDDTVASLDVPEALTTQTAEGDRIITIQSNQMHIDTSAWATDTNYFRALRVQGPDEIDELDFTREYVIEVDITTIVAGGVDQADDAQYWMGVWLRGRPDEVDVEERQYLFLGIVREAGTTQMQVHLSKFDDMLNPVRQSADIAPMDAAVHKLQIFVNRHYLECWLDGTQYIRTDISGLTLYSDQAGDHHWGLLFGRYRTANTWSATAHTPLFNNLKLYSGKQPANRRIHKLVGVSGGNVRVRDVLTGDFADSGGTMPAVLASIRRVLSVEIFQKIYYASGSDYKVYNANTNNTADWNGLSDRASPGDVPAAGELPGGNGKYGLHGASTYDDNARCPLVEKYQGAAMLAGKSDEPFNVFKSKNGDPEDFAYGGTDPGDAVAFNNSNVGEVGAAVRALVRMHENRMGFGCDKEFWALVGDPATDGELTQISSKIGIAGPRAWCGGEGREIFWLDRGGFYAMSPNAFNIDRTARISEFKLDRTLNSLDLDNLDIEMQYNTRRHGIDIFLTPRDGGEPFGYFWDQRDNAFNPDFYPDEMGAIASHHWKTDDLEDGLILIVGDDGYVRWFDPNSMWDDETPIDSSIVIPMRTGMASTHLSTLERMDIMLGPDTTGLNVEVLAHRDPHQMLNGQSKVFEVTLTGGGPNTIIQRALGSALWIRVKSHLTDRIKKQRWSIQEIEADMGEGGRSRGPRW